MRKALPVIFLTSIGNVFSDPTFAPSGSSLPSIEPSPNPSMARDKTPEMRTLEPSQSSFTGISPTNYSKERESASPSKLRIPSPWTPTDAPHLPDSASTLGRGGSHEPSALKHTWIFPTTDPIEFPSESPSTTVLISWSPSDVPIEAKFTSSVEAEESATPTTSSSIPSWIQSSIASHFPSSAPMRESSLYPMSDLSDLPPVSFSKSSIPSSRPTTSPSSRLSGVPLLSHDPSFRRSNHPSGLALILPIGSSLPSSVATDEPMETKLPVSTQRPSTFSKPGQLPSKMPSGSSLPSFVPSNEPSELPSDLVSGSPLVQFTPSTFPSGLLSAGPSGFPSSIETSTLAPVSANTETPMSLVPALVSVSASVMIPCRSQMDDTTIQVFQAAAVEFLMEYLPHESGITVTRVTVINQTLFSSGNRSLRVRILKETSELEIEMQVDGMQAQGTERHYFFADEIEKAFANSPEAFMKKLSEASSFFLAEFAFANSDERDISVSASQEDTDDGGSMIAVIVGSLVGSLVVIFAAMMLFLRHRYRHSYEESVSPLDLMSWSHSNEADDVERRVDLGSWSAKTPSAASGNGNMLYSFVDKDDACSPSDCETCEKDKRYAAGGSQVQLSPMANRKDIRNDDHHVASPQKEKFLSQVTARGSRLLRDLRISPTSRTTTNLGEIENMEGVREGQLDSCADALSETSKQNNLETFKIRKRSMTNKSTIAAF